MDFLVGAPWACVLPLGMGLVDSFATSNFAGKAIVIVLFVGSIVVWSVGVGKLIELNATRVATQRFLLAYRREPHPVSLYLKRQKFEQSPAYTVYERTCIALGDMLRAGGADTGDLFLGDVTSGRARLSEIQMNTVRHAAERSLAEQMLGVEAGCSVLSQATSVAPFLGLLGTVWGVMDAFSGMASGTGVMLADVAPGISGALLTTVVGLVVALPSSIAYNALVEQVRHISVSVEGFVDELLPDLERSYRQEK